MKAFFLFLFSALLAASSSMGLTAPPAATPVRLLFGGDLQFDRYIRQQVDRHGSTFPLELLHDRLITYDAVIANLEGPITDFPSRSVNSAFGSPNNYVFTFPITTGQLLYYENLRVVNLGNNHIGNFGAVGITQTQDRLTTEQIRYFGNVGNNTTNRFTVFTIRGLRVGLVNYNQFVSGGLAAVLADLEQIQPLADVVIVYTHWGEEYQTAASPAIQQLAHQFIDQGADVVIGSHPHVTQPEEIYLGKKIYYSLGNFVFDQYFQPETQRGLLAEVTIDPQSLDISTKSIPIRLQPNGQTKAQ